MFYLWPLVSVLKFYLLFTFGNLTIIFNNNIFMTLLYTLSRSGFCSEKIIYQDKKHGLISNDILGGTGILLF